MKKLLLSSCLFFFLFTISSAQIGITATYASAEAENWEFAFQQEFGSERQLFVNGSRVGLNYWFRLKPIRIEFLPSIEYADYGTWSSFSSPSDRLEYDLTSLGTFLNTRLYLFDFANDCNCPTFSKQNDWFKKGFFVNLAPGVERLRSSIVTKAGEESVTTAEEEWKLSGGVGVGIDFGISDFLTLTPIAGVSYSRDLNGDHLFDTTEPNASNTDLIQYYAGINIGLRFK
ncbi:MAG: hypothetical protein AAGI23_09795 [Bacteroidota bacterium]